MSLIIKGAEMPECCDICQFGHWSNLNQTASCMLLGYASCFRDFSVEYRVKRSDNCPLVEVPTPHGALIDADKLANTTLLNPLHAPYITINDLAGQLVVIEAED